MESNASKPRAKAIDVSDSFLVSFFFLIISAATC